MTPNTRAAVLGVSAALIACGLGTLPVAGNLPQKSVTPATAVAPPPPIIALWDGPRHPKPDVNGLMSDRSGSITAMNRKQPDPTFLANAAQYNIGRMQMAQVTLHRTNDPAIRQLAGRVLRQYRIAQDTLMQIAARLHIFLPLHPSQKALSTLQEINRRSPEEADRLFVTELRTGHRFSEESRQDSEPGARPQSTSRSTARNG